MPRWKWTTRAAARRAVGLCIGLAIATGAARARAGDHEPQVLLNHGDVAVVTVHPLDAHALDHDDEGPHGHHVRVALAGVFLVSLADHQTTAHRGGGLSAILPLARQGVELEFVAHLLLIEGGVEVPLDALVRLPIPINPWLEAYVALGPTLVPYVLPVRSGVHLGAASAVGLDAWITSHAGVAVEFNYNLFPLGDGFEHELGMTAGPVVGW